MNTADHLNYDISIASVLDAIPSMVFVKDAETGKFLYCNQKYADALNAGSVSEIIGKTEYELISKERADEYRAEDLKVLETGETQEHFEEIRTSGGQLLTIKTVKSKYTDPSGRECILGITDDATKTMEVLGELESTNYALKSYQKMNKSVSYHIIYEDDAKSVLDTAEIKWSGDIIEILRRNDAVELNEGKNWLDLVYPPDKEKLIEIVEKGFEDCDPNKELNCEYRVMTGERKLRWYAFVGLFYKRSKESPKEHIGIIFDINDTKEMELRQEIVDAISDSTVGLYYVDLIQDTFRIFKRPPFIKDSDLNVAFPYTQAMSNCIETVVAEEDRERMREAVSIENIRKQLKTANRFSLVYKTTGEAGERYAEMMISRPIQATTFDNVTIAFYDCHEQMMVQIEKEQLTKKLEQAYLEAKQANEAKTRFLFNMSHDIRTPMNAIIGYTSMAKKYSSDQKRVEDYMTKVEVSGQQLLELINQVLEMSRIESGKEELAPASVNVEEEIGKLKTITEADAVSKGITFSMDSDIKHKNVMADNSRVSQVLINILGNAVKYTPEGGNVSFSINETEGASENESNYVFTIKDNGIGMSKEFIPHVFDEFSRENSSTVSHVTGTGLGMSIVKKLVDLMHGSIHVESEKGAGTTVTVTLPLKHSDPEEIRKSEEKVSTDLNIEGMKVLLAEDNEMNREIAKEILKDNGVIVEEAEDGDVAVEMLVKGGPGHFDAILMDIQMPRMNGYEATRKIRSLEDKTLSEIPIIAMTANAFEEDRKEAFAAGMNEHLAKPINIMRLKETLGRFRK